MLGVAGFRDFGVQGCSNWGVRFGLRRCFSDAASGFAVWVMFDAGLLKEFAQSVRRTFSLLEHPKYAIQGPE